jgi:regulatory protein
MKLKKLSNGRYKIILNDGSVIETYDEIILKYNLLYKKEVDEITMSNILLENDYYDVYHKVVSYLTKKIHSKEEAIQYINKYNLDQKDIIKIINKMEELNLINDFNYTKAYINDRISLSNDGPIKIKNDLIKNGIAEDIINLEIENIDKEEVQLKLDKLIAKKLKANSKYGLNYMKEKLTNEFINLGYNKSDIISTIDKLNIDNSDIEKEYLKLKNKYSHKYSGYQLTSKIKEKLYHNGYSLDEINNVCSN